MTQDLRTEIDVLKQQMSEIQQLVKQLVTENHKTGSIFEGPSPIEHNSKEPKDLATIFYSGQYQGNGQLYRWEPQERNSRQLLSINSEKVSKVLSALGNKQRLEILRAILQEPLSGTELVERLKMGTTGQLYHHLKALQGTDLIAQDKNARYTVPGHRIFPFLLLLAAASDLMDTADYMDMIEARNNAGTYLGTTVKDEYDAHILLAAVIENSILEHLAGHCSEVSIFLHDDGSVTIADNGRGIPVKALPNTNKSTAQSVLTDIERFSADAPFLAPGAEKGISIAVVNALSSKLTVEIRREGNIYRQEYKYGIPQTGILTVGVTQESGTSVTFKPALELFGTGFERDKIQEKVNEIAFSYPGLSINIHV